MYRLLFFVLLFAILIPLVWRLVNYLFFRVSGALSDDAQNADEVIETFCKQRSALKARQEAVEKDARQAKEEVKKITKFSSKE